MSCDVACQFNENVSSRLVLLVTIGLAGCGDVKDGYHAVEGNSDSGLFNVENAEQILALGSLNEVRLKLPATGLTTRCGYVGERSCDQHQEAFNLIELESLDPEILSVERVGHVSWVNDPGNFSVRSHASGIARFRAEVVTDETKTRLVDAFSIRSAAADRVEFGSVRPAIGSFFSGCEGTHVVEGVGFKMGATRYNGEHELFGAETETPHWLFSVQGPATLSSDHSAPVSPHSPQIYSVELRTTGVGEVFLSSTLSTEDAKIIVVPVSAIDGATVVDSLDGEPGRVSTRFKVQVTASADGNGICDAPTDAEFVSETPEVCTVDRSGGQRGGTFIRGEEAGECRVAISIPGSSWAGTTLIREII